MPNLSQLAVRHRAVTLFLILAVAVSGVFAFLQLGRAEDPRFTLKVMTVAAVWPGATAAEMQEQVADRLEKRLQELAYFDRVETDSRPGQVLMTVLLRDTTPPSEVAGQFYQVRKSLGDEAPNLPQGVLGPFFNDEYSDAYFALYALTARGMPPRELVREAEAIRSRLLHTEGVQKVRILGEQPGRIYVEFDHERLATLGISAQQIVEALQKQNNVTSAGSSETAGPRVYVRVDGAFDGVEAIRATPIAAGDGRSLTLGDVTEVRRGYEDPPSFLIRNQGEPALMLGVVMQPRWNGLTLDEALNHQEAAIQEALPLGLEFHKVSDQALNIAHAYDEFMLKFVVALSVVMMISFLALGFRVGLVVALAVPLTLSAVFLVMLMTGRDFDRITLGAYELLKKCDADLAERCQKAGCLKCGGRLDRADYRRKPRGGPDEAEKIEQWRDSFCCDVDGCRKRHTPPSVRFLGRRVYWGVVVVLMAAMQHGLKPARVKAIQDQLKVDRQTMERWRTWWLTHFVESAFWKEMRARFMPVLCQKTLPLSLCDAFKIDRLDRLLKLLRFLRPLTTDWVPVAQANRGR